jgi:hypothetical protein
MQVSAMRQLADGRFDAQAAPVMTTAEAKEPAQACGRITRRLLLSLGNSLAAII